MLGDHPHVGDIRGRGLFWGIELVQDHGSRQWFDPALKLHARLKAAAMAEGLLIYPMGGTVDGLFKKSSTEFDKAFVQKASG